MNNEQPEQKPIIWWKDKKLLIGFVLVLLSIILGFYGKVLPLIRFYNPAYVLIGLSIWIFSWILLFLGVFLVGRETIKMIQTYINNQVKKTVKETYHYTKEFPKKSYYYTKGLQRKGVNKITKVSKAIAKRLGAKND